MTADSFYSVVTRITVGSSYSVVTRITVGSPYPVLIRRIIDSPYPVLITIIVDRPSSYDRILVDTIKSVTWVSIDKECWRKSKDRLFILEHQECAMICGYIYKLVIPNICSGQCELREMD